MGHISTNVRWGFWNKCCIFSSWKSMPFWGKANYLKGLSKLLPNGLTVSNRREMKSRPVNLRDSAGLLCSQDCSYGVRQQLNKTKLEIEGDSEQSKLESVTLSNRSPPQHNFLKKHKERIIKKKVLYKQIGPDNDPWHA